MREHVTRIRNRNKGVPAVVAGLLVAGLLSGVAVDAATASGNGQPALAAKHPDRPTRVVQIVLDQLRPQFIDAFDMKNVKRLIRNGASYPKAYLGHMASETVISHNVMTSGMLPKHMGWSDEWYPDDENLLTPEDDRFVTGSMSFGQFDTLINDKCYPKLTDYLHAKFPGTIVAAIGEKNYAVHTMGGPNADMRITFGSRNADCDEVPNEPTDLTWRGLPVTVCRHTSPGPCAAATTSTPTATSSTTGHWRPRRPGCTPSRATATCPASTPTTRAVMSGSPTWRST